MVEQSEHLNRSRDDIVADLERLTEQDGFIYAFCFLAFESLWFLPRRSSRHRLANASQCRRTLLSPRTPCQTPDQINSSAHSRVSTRPD